MTQDARERTKWKVRLSGWVDGLPSLIKRPVKKLILETTFGILSSGTLKQSEIARALKEPCRLHHTQKRLSRMLAHVSLIKQPLLLPRQEAWWWSRLFTAVREGRAEEIEAIMEHAPLITVP